MLAHGFPDADGSGVEDKAREEDANVAEQGANRRVEIRSGRGQGAEIDRDCP